MDYTLLNANYQDKNNSRLLIIEGPLNQKAIDSLASCSRFSFCPEDKEREWKGSVSFLVKTREECPGLIEKLNAILIKEGYFISSLT